MPYLLSVFYLLSIEGSVIVPVSPKFNYRVAYTQTNGSFHAQYGRGRKEYLAEADGKEGEEIFIRR